MDWLILLLTLALVFGIGILFGHSDLEDQKHRAEQAEEDSAYYLNEAIELRTRIADLEAKIAKLNKRAEKRGATLSHLWVERACLRGALMALLDEHIEWAKQYSYTEESIEKMPEVAYAKKALFGE
jgi:predicted nuclease with TOPRIM domain